MEILVNGRRQTMVCVVAIGLSFGFRMAATAETEEIPDMEFLEYLGMWEESDEDWLLLEEEEVAENDKRTDPVPEGEESTETEDES